MGNWEWNNILIADFHDIHWTSTDIWLSQNINRSLISYHFEFVWFETFWNAFRPSSAVVRIMSVLPKNFSSSEIGGLQRPLTPYAHGLINWHYWISAERGVRGLWLGGETAYLSKFDQTFNFELIDLSLQQLLQIFCFTVSVFIYFFDREWAVSWESCNLIGSGSGQYFPISWPRSW